MSDSSGYLCLLGGMKCGSSWVYDLLGGHTGVFAPERKEPEVLLRSSVAEAEVLRDRHFRRAASGALLLDGSTQYSQIGPNAHAIRMAPRVYPDAHFIFVVRDPLRQIVSHYRHLRRTGRVSGTLEAELRLTPALIEGAQFGRQVEAWVEAFGVERVRVMALEGIVADPVGAISQTVATMGLSAASYRVPEFARRNAGGDRIVAPNGLLARAVGSRLYQGWLKEIVPRSVRGRAKELLLSVGEDDSGTWESLNDASREYVLCQLHQDRLRLAGVFPDFVNLWEGLWPREG